jgi:hyperosmotically inducible protein
MKRDKPMKTNAKQMVLALTVGATVALTGLTGCSTGNRTAGRAMDDRMVARRVKHELAHAQIYKFPDVNVATYAGVVQLSGFIDTPDQRAKAGDIAARTSGVHEVVNSLVLKPTSTTMPSPGSTPTGYSTGQRLDATTAPANVNTNAPAAPIIQSGTPIQNNTQQP